METWQIWIMVALVFFIIELFTSGFAVFCISAGAVAAAAASGMDVGIEGQLICFSVATVVSFVTVRPVMVKYFQKRGTEVRTNTDSLIGRIVVVCETIDNRSNSGRVKIDGDVWRAVSRGDELIEAGEKAVVEQVDSTILTVKKS